MKRPRSARLAKHEMLAVRKGCPRQDSNLRTSLRRRVLYPLSYEGGESIVPAAIVRPGPRRGRVPCGDPFRAGGYPYEAKIPNR